MHSASGQNDISIHYEKLTDLPREINIKIHLNMQCQQDILSKLAGHKTFSLPVTASYMQCNHSHKFS